MIQFFQTFQSSPTRKSSKSLGSEPETRDEVAKAVGFVAAQDAHDKLSEAIQNLKNNDIASVAARLFVQRGFQLKVN